MAEKMTYTAELDIPLGGVDLDRFVDGLRAYGYPKITVTFETELSRRELIENVANEMSEFWRHGGDYMEKSWWQRVLSRGRRTKPASA